MSNMNIFVWSKERKLGRLQLFLRSVLCCVGPLFFEGGLRNSVHTYRGVMQMQTHCRQRGEGVKKGPKTAYILKERPLTYRWFLRTSCWFSEGAFWRCLAWRSIGWPPPPSPCVPDHLQPLPVSSGSPRAPDKKCNQRLWRIHKIKVNLLPSFSK